MEVDPPAPPETPATPGPALPGDSFYAVDETAVDAQRQAKPWTQDATYFKRVAVSPAASTKMLAHAQRGCEAGVKAGGKPLEVMGLLLGYPDADASKRRLVVTDALPLPVTGFETSVVADDDNVVNYMIALSDLVEKTRKERLMGWYHSHPFDVDEDHDNCFFSSTDLSTQLSWQNAEDPQGNPFLAIVLDPLRSAAKNSAALAAFRAYPPAYTPPANQCPDGEICADDARRVEVWGSCWHRYYQLDLEYFMSGQVLRRRRARFGRGIPRGGGAHDRSSAGARHRRRAQPEPPLGEDAERVPSRGHHGPRREDRRQARARTRSPAAACT